MFINQQYQFELYLDMFVFLWNECDNNKMSGKPYQEHRDYMKLLLCY